MKTLRSTIGPVRNRPYFTRDEIERLCTDELKALDLFPKEPQPIRIERFVEKRFGPVSYQDLPESIMGFTRFGRDGVEKIVVARSLIDAGRASSERRANTTLAHEAGHGLLHSHLFALETPPPSLFGPDNAEPMRILCRDDAFTHQRLRYDGRWWEFQANQVIGALLLPATLVQECISDYLEGRGLLGMKVLPARRREAAAIRVSEVFDVNPVVARIRLEQLFPVGDESQLTL
ncbi:MAG: ImmA/IrrE family metallo-endopeptidase [Candidatus Liptonbacteria bacterium]|nr:ImmA/IrrE family metallo-endopeptidase [Candidatus Liptonbacteria bacterium]